MASHGSSRQSSRQASRQRSATIHDVARLAGVSVATVSRVLNDSGPVSESTASRVRAAAAELRYVPNSAARSLITRRSSTLGVVLPDLYGDFFSEVIRGIDETAQRSAHHILISSSHADRSAVEAALHAMRGHVDGLIVMSPDIDAVALEAYVPANLPVVLLNCAIPGRAFDSIKIDNAGGAYAMTRHLIALGHRRVAFIRGAARNVDAAERLQGFHAALREHGLPRHAPWEPLGDFTDASGYDAARALLATGERPTAVFAANDAMAIGALSALRDAGMSVPEEIALAGFDDIPIARFVTPPLSSVHVPIHELGACATNTVLDAITHQNRHRRTRRLLPTTLVVRTSCGGSPDDGLPPDRSGPPRAAGRPVVATPRSAT